MADEKPIEAREVKGVSIKSLSWLIGSTFMLAGLIYGNYHLIKKDIGDVRESVERLQIENAGDEKYNDLRLQVMEQNIKAVELSIENLRNQINANRRSIEQQQDKK